MGEAHDDDGADVDKNDGGASDGGANDAGLGDGRAGESAVAGAGGGDAWTLPGNRFSRRAQIYAVAAKVGARYAAANRPFVSSAQRTLLIDRANRRGARDLHATAVHLRGSFLKLGQFVSARPDLLPPAYVTELAKLQDRVPPAPAAVIIKTIERDVGPVDELFGHFDATSASAASLAQVHRATRVDGSRVAVKVQYPRVREIVPREAKDTTRILDLVAHLVKGVDLRTIGRALEQNVLSEVDYEQEADNIDEFGRNFKDEPQIQIPGLHRDLSQGRVLVMDWVEGENLARALAHVDHAVASDALRILVDAFLKQILVDGFMHADPHPGNFLLQTDPLRIGMVDFGACARISEDTRHGLRELYRAGVEADMPAVGEALQQLGFRTEKGDVDGLVAFGSLFSFEDEDDVSREQNWNRLVAAAKENPLVKIPDELIMVGRVLIVQTGMVSRVRPSWNMDDLIRERLATSR